MEKTMNHRFLKICLMLLAVFCLTGCAGRSSEKVSTNTVEGFLFSFDQREKTRLLSEAIAKKEYPVKVSWCYDPANNAKELKAPETDETGAAEEGTRESEESAVVNETEDAEKIKGICLALSNAIIIDNAKDTSPETPYFVELTLADGTSCRFDFVSRSVIRLSEQNYAVETDGSLWRLLEE